MRVPKQTTNLIKMGSSLLIAKDTGPDSLIRRSRGESEGLPEGY
jgi:hypothetical protein